MLSVAGANSCRQCSFAHREWALAEGLLEAELVALEGLDAESFDAKKWAAVAWAQDATRSDFTSVPDAIDANFKQLYGHQEQADIELVARTMCWMNRVSNTVDAAIDRLRRKPVPGSGVGREVLAIVVYGLFVPVVLVVLGVKQKRRPMTLIRGIVPFFREFESRVVPTRSQGPDRASTNRRHGASGSQARGLRGARRAHGDDPRGGHDGVVRRSRAARHPPRAQEQPRGERHRARGARLGHDARPRARPLLRLPGVEPTRSRRQLRSTRSPHRSGAADAERRRWRRSARFPSSCCQRAPRTMPSVSCSDRCWAWPGTPLVVAEAHHGHGR